MKIFIHIVFLFAIGNLSIAQKISVTKFNESVTTPVLVQNQKLIKGVNTENFKVKSSKQENAKNIISDVIMVNQEYGFAIGSTIKNGGFYAGGSEESKLWVTHDGANTWQEAMIDKEVQLSFIKMVSITESQLFLHARPYSYLSSDGGRTWQKTLNSPTTYLSKLTVYNNGVIVAAGSTKATYSIDFGNTWQALNLPEGFNLEAITLKGQMIGAVVQENILKLLTVEEELNFDIFANELTERKPNNFPSEIKQSKKRFFKSHENGEFTLIFNIPSEKEGKLSSGIAVYSSSDNGSSWTKMFDYKKDNLMHIKDAKRDEDGIYVISPNELIAYTITQNEEENINNQLSQDIIVSPNPSSGNYLVQTKEDMISIAIFDIYGKQLNAANTSITATNEVKLDISNQPNGIFFVHINTQNGLLIEKIIKQ